MAPKYEFKPIVQKGKTTTPVNEANILRVGLKKLKQGLLKKFIKLLEDLKTHDKFMLILHNFDEDTWE